MIPHKAVVLSPLGIALMQGRRGDDIGVFSPPLPHVYGANLMNGMFLIGNKIVPYTRFDAACTLADIARYRATIFDGVATMWMFLLNAPELQTANVASLRLRAPGLQQRLDALEAEKAKLEQQFLLPEPTPVRFHPNVSEVYRRRVGFAHSLQAAGTSRLFAAFD